MAGYTRQDTANNIANGNVIDADDFDAEYNQVENAFNASTGHVHDGSTGEGAPIEKVGPAQELQITSAALQPKTDNALDLGTSSLEFKDGFFKGTLTANTFTADTADIDGGSVDGATLGTNSAITQAVIDNININGATIGHTDDTDLLTLADGIVTVAGEISVTTLDIGGTNVTSTGAELNILDGVTSTSTELNIVDGDTSATSTTLADADRVVVNDNGTMVQVALSDFETYFEAGLDTLSSVTTVGALNAGSITSGFGNIDNGSSTITTTGDADLGATTVDSLNVSDGNITNVGDIALDSISADDSDINVAVSDNSGTAFTIKQGSDSYLIVDTGNSSESVSIGTGVSGTAITIGHATSETTVADNLTVSGNATITGNLQIDGTTTTINSTALTVDDLNITVASGAGSASAANGAGITVDGASATLTYTSSNDRWNFNKDLVVSRVHGNLTGSVTGNADTATSAAALTGDVTKSGDFTVDASADIILDAAGDQIRLKDNGSERFVFNLDSTPEIDVTGDFKIDGSGDIELEGTDILLDASGDVTIDAGGGQINLADDGVTKGYIDVQTANTLDIYAGSTHQLQIHTSGVRIANGLYVGSTSGTLSDNDIVADGVVDGVGGIEVNGTSVISSSRVLQNVTGLKTINSTSILGSGNIAISDTNTGVGIGQSWSDQTSSRAADGTVYQNTTGSPIQVSISAEAGGGGVSNFQVSSDNSTYVTVSSVEDVNNSVSFGGIVPNNHYYKVAVASGSIILTFWSELR